MACIIRLKGIIPSRLVLVRPPSPAISRSDLRHTINQGISTFPRESFVERNGNEELSPVVYLSSRCCALRDLTLRNKGTRHEILA